MKSYTVPEIVVNRVFFEDIVTISGFGDIVDVKNLEFKTEDIVIPNRE